MILRDKDPTKSVTDRAIDFGYAKENKLQLDLSYYVSNQIMNPIKQLLEAFHEQPESLFEETLRILRNRQSNQLSLEMFGMINNNNDTKNKSTENDSAHEASKEPEAKKNSLKYLKDTQNKVESSGIKKIKVSQSSKITKGTKLKGSFSSKNNILAYF